MPAIGFANPIGRGGVRRPGSIRNTLGRNFFDRKAVESMMDKKTAGALSRFGYFVMRDARQKLRVRKKPSKPGQAPSLWTNAQTDAGWAMRMIYFYYERARRSVIIGPAKFPGHSRGSDTVPRILEEGGLVYPVQGKRPFRIAPRPYMQPAFDRQIQKQAARLYAGGIWVPGLN